MNRRTQSWLLPLTFLLALAVAHPVVARAGLTVSVYGIHMDPSDQDAKDFSRSSYGGGLQGSLAFHQLGNFVAGTLGIELVNMLSETHAFQDSKTGLRVEQQTNQDYFRVYLGPEFGPQGNGFLRPHVGVHVAFVNHGISTDVVVPNDSNRENEIRQNLRSENRPAFGYDVNAGTDLNFGKWFLLGGGRYSKSFNVPQQLGGGAVSIHPGYVQIYVGMGANFRY